MKESLQRGGRHKTNVSLVKLMRPPALENIDFYISQESSRRLSLGRISKRNLKKKTLRRHHHKSPAKKTAILKERGVKANIKN